MNPDQTVVMAEIRDAIRDYTSEYRRVSDEILKGHKAMMEGQRKQIKATLLLAFIFGVLATATGLAIILGRPV